MRQVTPVQPLQLRSRLLMLMIPPRPLPLAQQEQILLRTQVQDKRFIPSLRLMQLALLAMPLVVMMQVY